MLKEEAAGLCSQGDLILNPNSLSSYLANSITSWSLQFLHMKNGINILVRIRNIIRKAPSTLLEPEKCW